jgi:2-polyprenyl-3-methyl-5-hydroxy-6-metoxy-1,4-benzoquinol methylase
MGVTHETNDEQAKLWKGIGGQGWVEAQPVLDQMFRPFEDLLVEAVSDGSRRQVLDVGCGTGSTTLALARVVGAGGR